MMGTQGMEMMELEYKDRLAAVIAERDKLKKFKEYVHDRLDAAGVPVDPESSHKAEWCRIDGRLDIVLAVYAADRLHTEQEVRGGAW